METEKAPSYSIALIAALNEEATIRTVVKGALQYVDEVIVVNDCSSDATGVRAREAGALVLNQDTNRGYDCALQKGFEYALQRGAQIILTIDGDGQHNPEDIPKFLRPIIAGKADMVIGQRPTFNHFCERIFSCYSFLRYGVRDPLCGLKAYSREVCERIGHFDTLGSIGSQLMFEAIGHGFRAVFVPVYIRERAGGDISRFYIRRIQGNLKILKAMIRVIINISK